MLSLFLWCEKQFQGLGHGQRAGKLASQFIVLVQGTALMANTFKDPKLTAKMAVSAEDWLKDLRSKSDKKHDAKILDTVY
jgi:hypothetical protein